MQKKLEFKKIKKGGDTVKHARRIEQVKKETHSHTHIECVSSTYRLIGMVKPYSVYRNDNQREYSIILYYNEHSVGI